jgi:hypothetical protein
MAKPSLWSRARAAFGTGPALPGPNRTLTLTATGFEVADDLTGRAEAVARWDEITRIRTYKVDLVTTDCICLLFERAAAEPLQVSEEWNGFVDLMEMMRERFPTIPSDWYEAVMQPPFERNETTLFEMVTS